MARKLLASEIKHIEVGTESYKSGLSDWEMSRVTASTAEKIIFLANLFNENEEIMAVERELNGYCMMVGEKETFKLFDDGTLMDVRQGSEFEPINIYQNL